MLLVFTALISGQTMSAFAAESDDTSSPSDVENPAAFPGDGEITLSWDPATDDTDVAGYYVYSGLYSVSADGGSYTFGSSDVGDTTTYTMENLSNGVTYYFAITAYDAAGNESEYYSEEVEATPEESGTGDFTEPTVTDAEALTGTLVTVTFSENVILPTDASSAFSIEASDGTALEVLDAYASDEDHVVFVVTSEQTAGAQYMLTAGIDIEDEAGNPIVSGTSDTAVFTGSSATGVAENDVGTSADVSANMESSGFELDEIEATDENELTLTFSEAVAYADPDSFTIEQADDALISILVLAVSIDADDPTQVVLITETMDAGFEYVLSLDDTVLNKDGESLSLDSREMNFEADTKDLADLIAPEDVTNFFAEAMNETTALLSWDGSVNSEGDLAEYMLYQSDDGGISFADAVKVAKELTEQEVDGLTPGETYTFKITAVDENGNESDGVFAEVTLPETGPGMIAMFGLSMLGAGVLQRRRH